MMHSSERSRVTMAPADFHSERFSASGGVQGEALTPSQARLLSEMEKGGRLVQTSYREGRPVQIFLRLVCGGELEVRTSLVKGLVRRSLIRMSRLDSGPYEWGFELGGLAHA